MPTPLRFLALPLLLTAAPAFAQSPFDGTWKADLSSVAVQGKPDRFTIKDGVYSCATCIPPYSTPADGAFHAVKDRPYWDEVAITVVDDRTVKYSFRKGGKVIADNTNTVSADGMTLTSASHNTNNGGGVPIDTASSSTRVGAAVPGAHLTSGDWKVTPANAVSEAAMKLSLKVSGGMLHMKTGLGETLDAKIGGPYALNQGDPGKTMTKVAQLGPKSMQLTDMRAGKVVQISTWTLGADGKIKGSWRDPRNGDTGSWVATRQ